MTESNAPVFPPHTWWWHREPDGRRVLWPLMTLETCCLPPPYVPKAPFRCVHCKVEGTAAELQKMHCSDSNWYHGYIRFYRQRFTPMQCLGKDLLDNLPCGNVWIADATDGLAGPRCPTCGSLDTEDSELISQKKEL